MVREGLPALTGLGVAPVPDDGNVREGGGGYSFDDEDSSVPAHEMFANEDKPIQQATAAPTLVNHHERRRTQITTLFWFVLGCAIGFFVVFGIGSKRIRDDNNDNEPREVVPSPTTRAPVASPPTPTPPTPTTVTPTRVPTLRPTPENIFNPTPTMLPTTIPPTTNSPITVPTLAPPTLVDFSAAADDTEPLVFFHLAAEETNVTVDVILPPDESTNSSDLYVVLQRDVLPGSSCPPVDGTFVGGNGTDSIFLTNSVDTVVVLCINEVVVAQSYFLFEEFVEESEVSISFCLAQAFVVDVFLSRETLVCVYMYISFPTPLWKPSSLMQSQNHFYSKERFPLDRESIAREAVSSSCTATTMHQWMDDDAY